MDPVSVAAGVATIIAVIGNSVVRLNALRIQCQDAEFRLELLIGHLESVQAALNQVQLAVTECLALQAQHQQLARDLHRQLGFCKLLVQHIDNQIKKIWTPGCTLKLEKRVMLVLEDKAIEEYLTRLAHQLATLNLCLTAFKIRTPQEQKIYLRKAESRVILERAEDDASSLVNFNASSSLFGVDDSASIASTRPASIMSTQSRLSKVFAFDEVLLRHKVYLRSYRFMLRRASAPISEDHSPISRSSSPTNMSALELRDSNERSARLDTMLKADAQKKSSELKIISLGHKRSTVAKHLRSQFGPSFSDEELLECRRTIVECLVGLILQIVEDVKTRGAGFATDQARSHVEVLEEFAESARPDWQVSLEVSTAARALCRHWLVQQYFHQTAKGDCLTPYYFNAADRILRPDFQPNLIDIIRAPDRLSTVRETKLSLDDLDISLIEVPHGILGRIIHQFDDIDACLLTLDLASYDRYNEEDDEGHNTLEQGLRLFKAICRVFRAKPIFVICVNFRAFRDKLATSPLSIHFSDYKGGCNPTAAADYILKRCKRMVVKDQDFFHHFAEDEAEDPSTIEFFGKKAVSLPGTAYLVRALGLKPAMTTTASERYRAVFRPRLLSSHTI